MNSPHHDVVPPFARAATGVLATATALAAGHLLAGATTPNSSPYLAVGNTAITLTPEPVKEFAIQQFGTGDKVALLLGMALTIALLAVAAGLVARRSATPGAAVIAAFGVVGIAAAASRPDASALPAIVSALVGPGVFAGLHRLARRPSTADSATPPSPDRRTFLRASAAVAVASGAAGAGGQLLAQRSTASQSRLRAQNLVRAQPAPEIPPGADFARAGTPTFLTGNRDFYRIDTALSVPELTLRDWTLRVHGMVDRELVLSFDELVRHRTIARPITLVCVSNEVGGDLISTATFTGVPVRDVLRSAGVRRGAQQVLSRSSDGFTAGTPLDALLDPDRDAMLAFGMNGEPLPAEHGFPVRLVTPGLYGYVSATKWLTELELTTFDVPAYWQQRGWSPAGPIKTQSRIDRPRPFTKVPAGKFTAAGIAWAQHTGIERVEVRVDGGPWRAAQLSTEVSSDTWRMWRLDVDLPPGGHTLECRATDRTGQVQTAQRTPVAPSGATGWHSVFCTAG